jgi:hypothetical protein
MLMVWLFVDYSIVTSFADGTTGFLPGGYDLKIDQHRFKIVSSTSGIVRGHWMLG